MVALSIQSMSICPRGYLPNIQIHPLTGYPINSLYVLLIILGKQVVAHRLQVSHDSTEPRTLPARRRSRRRAPSNSTGMVKKKGLGCVIRSRTRNLEQIFLFRAPSTQMPNNMVYLNLGGPSGKPLPVLTVADLISNLG